MVENVIRVRSCSVRLPSARCFRELRRFDFPLPERRDFSGVRLQNICIRVSVFAGVL